MLSSCKKSKINSDSLTELFNKLKSLYNSDTIDINRKEFIINQVKKYGYLPCSHLTALEELTEAETIIGIEEKLKLNGILNDGQFVFRDDEVSPVKRAGFTDSSWIKTEQHNIKLTNLAGLGNGNNSKEPGRFIDWLKQLLILPAGNLEKGVLSTTMYLIPFHPRDFGCAYLPTSSDVSNNLEDPCVKRVLEFDAKEQIQLFLTLSQLAGHPIMLDVLPQTGRFSKTVLANPYIARWFNVKELISIYNNELNDIAENLKQHHHWGDVDYIKGLISNSLSGQYENIPDHLRYLADIFEQELDTKRNYYSNEMCKKENQETLYLNVKKIINTVAGFDESIDLTEDDITNQGEVIGTLISKGLWPAPGGAWCSSGVPVFNKMSEGAGFPLFKHYDHENNDVTHHANLDCQTPYYFVYLENCESNEKVIDFYVDFLKKLQSDYNFDGFRVDHVDHIVDKYSETESGQHICYRAPRYVLGKSNSELKKAVPYFATLAEYMLWDKYYKEYHRDMNFDLLWGNDIVSQFIKNTGRIVGDNKELEHYNSLLAQDEPKLSILKAYNNQDGEFRAIDQYPGQLQETGALFKWFKFKFLPQGQLGQRPVMFIDGDESFTIGGIEEVIGSEESMKRSNNKDFFNKFDAINRFALNNDLTRYGVAEIYHPNYDSSGFITWFIRKEIYDDNERLFIVANEHAPTEVMRKGREDGSIEITNLEGHPVYNKEAYIPEGFKAECEYILPEGSLDFEETSVIHNLYDNKIFFDKLEPSEYHIYKIVRA